MNAQDARRPAKVRLEDLTDVHARGHAERVEHDFNRSTVRKIRHVLFRQNPRDDTLVSVSPGHLVAN